MWIQTLTAWYALGQPLQGYANMYYKFLRPHKVAQFIICTVQSSPSISYKMFLQRLQEHEDHLLGTYTDGDLPSAVCHY
jgi:hypothetical protein